MKKALFCDKYIDYFKLNLENKRIKDTPAVAGVDIFMTYLILHLTRESFSLANHFFSFLTADLAIFLTQSSVREWRTRSKRKYVLLVHD